MEDFDSKLNEFVNNLQEMINKYYAECYTNLIPCKISTMPGKKYVRIVRTSDGGSGQRSVFCFIEKPSGDIYKSATWKAPAKHVRGNIFVSLTDGINVYGADYLR